MKRAAASIFMLMLCVALLAGCASAAREAAFRREEAALFEARQRAAVRCDPRVDCDMAWTRTRAFIAAHSFSRIVRVDDTSIETAWPHAFGFVYLAALKEPTDDGHMLIQLKAMCRGMYDTDGNASVMYSTCANSIVAIEAGYRTWMHAAP